MTWECSARCATSICSRSSTSTTSTPRSSTSGWKRSRFGHLVDVSGPLAAAAALVVFDDTLAALEALHGGGDHPSRRDPGTRCCSTPAGPAILRDAGVPAPPLRRGWRAGTPQYMAPELWAGRPHTVSTDHLRGHRRPGRCGSPDDRRISGTDLSGPRRAAHPGALPSEAVPLLARELVIRGLAKDPRDRPASAGGVPSRRRGRRHRLPRGELAGSGTRVAGGGGGGASRRPGSRPRRRSSSSTTMTTRRSPGLRFDTAADERRAPAGWGGRSGRSRPQRWPRSS